MQISPLSNGSSSTYPAHKGPANRAPTGGAPAGGAPDIKAVCKMAKNMVAFNIIDSFLAAKQSEPMVVTIRPLNMYQPGPNGAGAQRVVQGQTAAMMLEMLG